ncbi:BTAD domain-containing putative transcriptional regulator [Arthrobacter oryzae]|uniref:BTAD domain-containing putative transcriptional regulator n=1 Tax=Arthrobacter oryzae TaxID=409290 RepID=UPI0028628711|nr:BTAD domain-containing putative transcriptional regulator [Arthrobacter oryzae]MDR6505144.1 DNA-binding SARP family transcriptional activator/ActR/RegA family two-component response regulator [Arthrobacter oryzae]
MLDLVTASKPQHPPWGPRLKAQSGKLDVSILGPLTIRRGTETLGAHELGGPKPRQILEILLLHLGAPVSKGRLIDLLWEGQAPAVALPTLESHVSVLRRHLQPGTGKAGPLKTVTGGYLMDRALVNLDLDRFDVLFRLAAQTEPCRALSFLTEALALAPAPLLGGELLPAWAEEERAMHASRVVEAKVLAAEAACSLGDSETAIAWATAALEDDVLAERAWTVLVLGLEATGQLTAALRAFDRCRHVMDKEMGCAPGPVLRAAHARLLQCTAAADAGAMEKVLEIAGMASVRRPASIAVGGPESAAAGRLVLAVGCDAGFVDLLTEALDREPDLQSIGAATTVESGVALKRALKPDAVIMTYQLPDGTGLEAARQMLLESPETRIVILTAECTPAALCEASALGVCAFLPEDGPLALILDTLRHVKTGNMLVHPSIVARLGEGGA